MRKLEVPESNLHRWLSCFANVRIPRDMALLESVSVGSGETGDYIFLRSTLSKTVKKSSTRCSTGFF